MCAQSLKFGVDSIYLPIDIRCQLLLALKNLIKHHFCLALLSMWWWILVRKISISFVIVVVVGFCYRELWL